jgi:hypothetical protein
MVLSFENDHIGGRKAGEDFRVQLPTEGQLGLSPNEKHDRAGVDPVRRAVLQVFIEALVHTTHINFELHRFVEGSIFSCKD